LRIRWRQEPPYLEHGNLSVLWSPSSARTVWTMLIVLSDNHDLPDTADDCLGIEAWWLGANMIDATTIRYRASDDLLSSEYHFLGLPRLLVWD
jgi:hypothetical protein